MAKASLDELAIRIAIASPIIGSRWEHKSGGIYEITGVSIQESDGDLLYTYRPVGKDVHPAIRFTRPAFEWNLTAKGDTRPRFVPWKGLVDDN